MTPKKRKNYKKEKFSFNDLFMAAACALTAFLPLVARAELIKLSEIEAQYYINTSGYKIDYALYCKEQLLGILAGVFLIYILGRFFMLKKEKVALKELLLPLTAIGVYILFMCASSALSEHREVTLMGVSEEYEGLVALISYAVLFVFGLLCFDNAKYVKYLKYALAAVCLIVGLLSLTELLYSSLLNIPFFKKLIAPGKIGMLMNDIEMNIYGLSEVTFYNPGYLGGFCTLMIPFMFAASLKADRKGERVLFIADTILMIVAMKGSDSRASFIATGFCMFWMIIGMTVIFGRESGFKGLIKTDRMKRMTLNTAIIAAGAAVIISAVAVLQPYTAVWKKEAKSGTGSIEDTLGGNMEDVAANTGSGLFRLSSAELINGELIFVSGEDTLKICIDKEIFNRELNAEFGDMTKCLIFSDGEKDIVIGDSGTVPAILKKTLHTPAMEGRRTTDERYSMITWAVAGRVLLIDFGYKEVVEYVMLTDGFGSVTQNGAISDIIPQPAVTGYERFYSFATGRGYIWIQSVPVLRKSLLTGVGPGNYGFNFIQYETAGLLNAHGNAGLIIDHPHNWYLQLWTEGGLPALLAVLVLFVYYLLKGLRHFFGKNVSEPVDVISAGIYTGVIAFMIVGMINSSYVTVNPIFWLLLGIGMSNMHNNALNIVMLQK